MRKTHAGVEAALLAQTLAYLRLAGIPHWRANAGAIRDARGRPVPMAPAGTPDVIACLPPAGRLLGIELKSPAGRMRPSQTAWRDTFAAAGALCWTVRSLDELRRLLREAGFDAP